MGPWLLFQMINGGTIALFGGVTSTHLFCKFVESANVSMLGVVPSLVKAWQNSNATANCDWSCVDKFSSSGEDTNLSLSTVEALRLLDLFFLRRWYNPMFRVCFQPLCWDLIY